MEEKQKILIVEDEESIAELERDYLELSGFFLADLHFADFCSIFAVARGARKCSPFLGHYSPKSPRTSPPTG